MLVCDSENNVIRVTFKDRDCEEVDYTENFRKFLSESFWNNITSYEVTCCSGNQCDYAQERIYRTETCSSDISGLDSGSKIIGV